MRMSARRRTSGRSGEAAASAAWARTGRRFANSSSAERRSSSASSGRAAAADHPRRARRRRRAAPHRPRGRPRAWPAGSALPGASIAAPPTELLVPAHLEAEALAGGIDAASRRRADLGSDPVAGKVGNAVGGHAPLPAVVAGFATTACSAMSLLTAARYARRLASTTLVDNPWPVKVRGTSVSPAGAAILTVASP